MRACFVTAIVLTLTLPATAAAQVQAAELNRALGALQAAIESLPPAQKLPRLIEAGNWLSRRSTNTNPGQVSESYLRSLERAAELLTDRPAPSVIEDVASELEAKVEHCRTLGIGMGGSVLLRVSTRRGPETVSDWQVFYLLKIYEHASVLFPNTFPKLSTPTETQLDPGRYWIWARDPLTGRTSERVLVRIVGQTAFGLDLPIP